MKRWDLIIDRTPAGGAWNMAVDEYLFLSLSDTPATSVRFYQWARPTVSLGYSQDIERAADTAFCRDNGIDIVRRITGGKLVLHHDEVTYSVSSSDTETFTENLGDSYRLVSRGLMCGLEKMELQVSLAGPPPAAYVRGVLPCFSHPGLDEVEWEGKKLIGSAQKRVASRFLQHGSIPLVKHEDLLRAVSFLDRKTSRLRMGSLSEALGRPVVFGWSVDRFAAGLEDLFGVEFTPRLFSPEETAAIQSIRKARYENPDWTLRRNPDLTVAF